jgi:phosphonopyruvate decarboxylase
VLTKKELLAPLAELRGDAIVVTCMGVTRPWGEFSSSDWDFASADSAMGHSADLALGIALAQPRRKVVCLNGDGSMLMTLGTLATIVDAGPPNLVLFVIQNDVYEITENLPIPAASRINFPLLARGAGFERVYEFDSADRYKEKLAEVLSGDGPVFVAVYVEKGSEGAISRSDRERSRYLQVSIAESAHRLREVLGA